ncbi:MAG: DMT family transporter [Saprospiraceae bacterium]|nr:DMT family transporter [Saprospiraceae bacterium]
MSNNYTTNRAYLELHFSVLLWGFTGILGRLITIDSSLLVWYRLLFTSLTLLLIPKLFHHLRQLDRRTVGQLFGIGAIAATHWLTFYGAIQYSNVSVAVGCLATTSLFTSFIEPLFTKKKIKLLEVGIGAVVTIGLGIMFFYGMNFLTGIILGISSAFFAALFTTFNKIVVDTKNPNPSAMTFVVMFGGWVFLCLTVPVYLQFFPQERLIPTQNDLFWLIVLAVGCTTLPFILSLRAMKRLSAFASVLAINMEPIYSIILALIIFQENRELDWRFYLGTAIVTLAIFLFPVLQKKKIVKDE